MLLVGDQKTAIITQNHRKSVTNSKKQIQAIHPLFIRMLLACLINNG